MPSSKRERALTSACPPSGNSNVECVCMCLRACLGRVASAQVPLYSIIYTTYEGNIPYVDLAKIMRFVVLRKTALTYLAKLYLFIGYCIGEMVMDLNYVLW